MRRKTTAVNSWKIIVIVFIFFSCTSQPKEVILSEEDQELSLSTATPTGSAKISKLSDYGFFSGELRNLQPAEGVIPYHINAPLFSDYAAKKRFIYLPKGKKINYHNNDILAFPEGTVLIKNFVYPQSGKQEGDQIIETRLLILKNDGWEALPYIWNEEQTDAFLQPAGGNAKINFEQSDGQILNINYNIPNQTQCKNCHARGDKIMPIGPSARQLNNGVKENNQLIKWAAAGILNGLPSIDQIPQLIGYEKNTASTELRARSWLEANCAHCHREDGPAKTSGLHLLASVTDPLRLGVGKAPIAAGKGSGGRKYDIVPGDPDASILYYRIVSNDPGVMMPELGRSVIDREGADLIAEWIREMK